MDDFFGDKGGVLDVGVSLLGGLTLIYSRSDCSDGTEVGPIPEGFLDVIFGGVVDIVILDGGILTLIYSCSTISGAEDVDDFGETGGVFIPCGNFGGSTGSFFILNFEAIVINEKKSSSELCAIQINKMKFCVSLEEFFIQDKVEYQQK